MAPDGTVFGEHPMGVWDVGSQRQNANLMMCICDWIVPGHDNVFQVNAPASRTLTHDCR
jgi:hypothetical protein